MNGRRRFCLFPNHLNKPNRVTVRHPAEDMVNCICDSAGCLFFGIERPNREAAYSYDAMNRLIAMVQDGVSCGYTYDNRGNLNEMLDL